MRAGKLDAVIIIQSVTSTIREDGVPIEAWTEYARIRAEILESGTEQFFRAYGAVDVEQTIFRVRYLSGLKTTHRIVFAGVTYRISKINEIRRKRGFEITAVTA